jgi:hypothetical protein
MVTSLPHLLPSCPSRCCFVPEKLTRSLPRHSRLLVFSSPLTSLPKMCCNLGSLLDILLQCPSGRIMGLGLSVGDSLRTI